MTLRDLEQYSDLCKECAELRERIARLEASVLVEHAKVQGSMNRFPYVKRSFVVTGIGKRQTSRLNALRIQLGQHEMELTAKTLEIEQWLGTVGDARIRRVIRLKFEDGLTWRAVAKRVYGAPSFEDAVKKKFYRFISECPECPESKM